MIVEHEATEALEGCALEVPAVEVQRVPVAEDDGERARQRFGGLVDLGVELDAVAGLDDVRLTTPGPESLDEFDVALSPPAHQVFFDRESADRRTRRRTGGKKSGGRTNQAGPA